MKINGTISDFIQSPPPVAPQQSPIGKIADEIGTVLGTVADFALDEGETLFAIGLNDLHKLQAAVAQLQKLA